MRTIFVCLLVVGAILLTALHASAQDRWAPWVGCWDRVAENVRDADGAESPAAFPAAEAPRVCVTPSGPDAVRLTTMVPDQDPIEEVLTADGTPHPIEEGNCRGTETLTWSRSGERLFARAQVTCGVSEQREVSGLGFITPNGTWLDIRSVTIEGVSTTRVSRYQRVGPEAATGRLLPGGSGPLTIADLVEIHENASDAVLEAAIAETNPRLPVRASTLTRLADAGVSPRVIDVIVALAYPERFIVERTGRISTITAASAAPGPFGIDDYYLSGFYYPAYYYSPFGYSYIGWYDPYLLRYSGGGRPGGPGGIQPSGTARAISGEGYTRIRSADETQAGAGAPGRRAVLRPPDVTTQSGGGGTTVTSGSSSSSGSSGGSSSDGGGSSGGGGGASPGGFSSGGGGDTGRTAQPR